MAVSRTTSRKAVAKAMANQNGETKDASRSGFGQDKIQEAIRLKAYELYLQRGCAHGYDVQDWIAAEQIFLSQVI